MMKQGDPATEMFVILSGTADILINDIYVNTVREKNIIGEAIMEVTVSPRTASVITTSAVATIVLTRDNYRQTMLQYRILE